MAEAPLPLEEAVSKETAARLRVEATEEALSVSCKRLEEANRVARRSVVPEIAQRHAASIEKFATAAETARDAVLEMRETEAAANTVMGGQSLIRVFMPQWLPVLYFDGRHEIDQAAQFRKKALREIEIMFAGLAKKGVKNSAKVIRKAAKSGGLRFVKKLFAQ